MEVSNNTPANSHPHEATIEASDDPFPVYDNARTYYLSDERHNTNRYHARSRTFSQVRHVSSSTAHRSPRLTSPCSMTRFSRWNVWRW
jgi:hypothetical protein